MWVCVWVCGGSQASRKAGAKAGKSTEEVRVRKLLIIGLGKIKVCGKVTGNDLGRQEEARSQRALLFCYGVWAFFPVHNGRTVLLRGSRGSDTVRFKAVTGHCSTSKADRCSGPEADGGACRAEWLLVGFCQ